MIPYLIQRAKFKSPIDENRTGIDRIIKLDYMGSAEFEFGELPKSLKRIRDNIDNYTYFKYAFSTGKVVTVFCKKEDRKKMGEILENLLAKKIRLKEFCDLDKYVNNEVAGYLNNDFWWDIINDFMFWKFNSEFNEEFKISITPTTV
jgi:hypothetical protein